MPRLRRVVRTGGDVDGDTDARARRGGPQCRGEATRVEQRRVDPLRELRRLVERLLHVASISSSSSFAAAGPASMHEPVRCRLTASATSC